ncbi:MAG: hypothetical protein J6F30_10580 [Cellulosilyticum sp.]|nr:hypothetical protein [Cellulosilyticum sp.]
MRKINFVAILIILFCGIEIINILKENWISEVKTVTSEGIIAEVDKVKDEGDKWLIEVSLRKEDGRAFEEAIELGHVNLDFIGGDHRAWQKKWKRSSDGKVLNCLIEIYGKGRRRTKGIEIELDRLVQVTKGEQRLEQSIEELYLDYPLEWDYKEEVSQNHNPQATQKQYVPLQKVADFSVIGVGFGKRYDSGASEQDKKELLHIRTASNSQDGEGESEASIDSLYNTQTGEEISLFYSSSTPESIYDTDENRKWSKRVITETYYELTHTEKLKDIQPVVVYTLREETSSGKWNLKVKLK